MAAAGPVRGADPGSATREVMDASGGYLRNNSVPRHQRPVGKSRTRYSHVSGLA
jgi:hypothetical protein